jgi:hypothetical protein
MTAYLYFIYIEWVSGFTDIKRLPVRQGIIFLRLVKIKLSGVTYRQPGLLFVAEF